MQKRECAWPDRLSLSKQRELKFANIRLALPFTWAISIPAGGARGKATCGK